ncbi:MAG: acyl-CoA carboxylase subunit beta [Ardenticatenaceae bacterium]|nr:acyl-CoA carboxylase subunit beta [Ardenticatenaceae bacterium]
MAIFNSQISTNSDTFAQNRRGMLALINQMRQLEARAEQASAKSKERFDKRGQLLPRERLARLLDPGTPFLEIGNMAGYLRDSDNRDRSIPGAGVIAGIGFVSGVRAMIVATDSGINAGAITEIGGAKMTRCQDIALESKLPFIHLVESAGANLLEYRVQLFIQGGALFQKFAKLSAAGCPVITVLHGSSTAGGAYMPGMSDIVIGVRGRGQAFLAGPPLVRAATGEIAEAEALGGAEMHATISGLVEHLAENDGDGIRLAREVVAKLNWEAVGGKPATFAPPRYDPDEVAGIVPLDYRQPYDVKEVIARLVDGSDLLEFKSRYGSQTVCVQANVHGMPCAFIGNNGPIDPDGATKVTHFIQLCCQSNTPLIFLQNTTGYMVGTAYEQGGMIKHGSKMIQAVSNATVPRLTLMIGASFGAGNYGMCGRAYNPRFLFSWPNAVTGVMGGEQAAMTMRLVMEASAARRGQTIEPAILAAQEQQIIDHFNGQSDAFFTSGWLLDDGLIDPRDSRKVLAFLLATVREGEKRPLFPNTFGVARM